MLQIWNLKHSKHFWIIKRVGLESIILSINLNDTSCYIIFSTFDYVFLFINLSLFKKKNFYPFDDVIYNNHIHIHTKHNGN